MAELSRFHTIANQSVVVPAEIDDALWRRFRRTPKPQPARIFGVGLGHITGGPSIGEGGIDRLPTRLRGALGADGLRRALERSLLLGPPSGSSQETDANARAIGALQRQYADGQVAHRERLHGAGQGKGKTLRTALAGLNLGDIYQEVVAGLGRALVLEEEFLALGDDGLEQFLNDLPSRAITVAMERARHSSLQERFVDGDLNDVIALSTAAAYCDVVVTERQWAHHLDRQDVAGRFGAQVLASLAALPQAIVTRTAGD
jgi:hypothetical protein